MKELLSKFDPEALIKPKTRKDILALLEEGIFEMKNLKDELDRDLGRTASESFRVGKHHFYQYLDKNDAAHIEWLSSEKKEDVLSKNRVAQVGDIVEIFVFDSSCRATNKHGTYIGDMVLLDWKTDKWGFVSVSINGKIHEISVKSKYPYDGEREVVKWMVENNLLETFMELK